MPAGNTSSQPSHGGEDETGAAEALIHLHRHSTYALRRVINNNNGNFSESIRDIIRSTSEYHARFGVKPSEQLQANEQKRKRRVDTDAAFSLIKLSGQSRTDSAAAWWLVKLRRECNSVLRREHIRRTLIADRARTAQEQHKQLLQKKMDETKKITAIEKFREKYPQMLGTTSTRDGKALTKERMVEVLDDGDDGLEAVDAR